MGTPRDIPTPDLQPRPSISSAHRRVLLRVNQSSSGAQSSDTWTSTNGDVLSDTDEIDDRGGFVDEYNKLARKYGVRSLIPEFESHADEGITPRRNWWSRTFRRTSSQSTENSVKRRRSVSHVRAHVLHPKRDSLKDQDLQGLVRLCGKSFLYLPSEYAPGSLVLPTCFRATAQYLVQYAPETRGVFRIPGSVRIVNELYEYYCAEQSGEDVANTVRSPHLPPHINASVHDVASAFKKFLAGVPGGILGSLSLFDALVAINSQLYTDLEINKTKQSKIRARFIALAVGTVRSQFRRELICAVFGLLCMLGRAAETTLREDEYGRPLPTSDLMGYNALGIVFGPLLVGDILGSHAVKLADPSAGVFLIPASPKPHAKLKKKRKDGKESLDEPQQQAFLDVDKVHIANDITEMLIANWRDVVKQMRSLDGNLNFSRHHNRASTDEPRQASGLGPSEDIVTHNKALGKRTSEDRAATPTASSSRAVSFKQINDTDDALSLEKAQPDSDILVANVRRGSNLGILSPPREESGDEDRSPPLVQSITPLRSSLKPTSKWLQERPTNNDPGGEENECYFTPMEERSPTPEDIPEAVDATDYGPQRQESKASSVNRQSSKTSKSSCRTQGSPERRLTPKSSCDHDLKTAYTCSPRAKVLSGKSTMRFQPKDSPVDSMVEPVKSAPARQSAGSGIGYGADSTKFTGGNDIAAGDQMDGTAVDLVVSATPGHRFSHEFRGDFDRRGSRGSRLSLIPLEHGRFELQGDLDLKHHDIGVDPKRLSQGSQSKRSLGSLISGSGDVDLGASKVMGLAAMFDNAAKAYPLVPTPEGAVQKTRRESPMVVSPYTSNPSPRASIHSATSVSTPPSLISHTRNSVCSSGTAEHSDRLSITPRRRDFAVTDGPGSNRGQTGPGHARLPGNPPNKSSRIVTPSRLPVRKKGFTPSPPSLKRLNVRPELVSRPSKLPVKTTTPQKGLTNGYYSMPITRLNSYMGTPARGHSYKGLTHLSQISTTSTNGETLINSEETSSLGHSPTSMTRSASSLRDQIRSLRQELSSKSEECAQLLLDLQESRKTNNVSEMIIREDLDRYTADCIKWKRRAEMAERRVDKFEQLATRIKEARELGVGRKSRGEGDLDDFSFIGGPDHLDIGERLPHQQQSARMNQGARRAPENGHTSGSLSVDPLDALSDCSGSTVVRNTNGGREGNKSALWTTIDELVDFVSPGMEDNRI